MVVVLCIVFLVAGVSLYDYFTARKWQQVTSANRNDIVFENRNQEYGAFVLRRDYDKRMVFIMLGVCLTIGAAFTVLTIIKNMPEEVIEVPNSDTQFDIPAPPLEDVPPPPTEEPPPPQEKTVAFMPPVIVDIPVEEDIPTQEDMKDTKADTKTNETENENWDPLVIGEEKVKEVIVEKKEEEILEFVEEDATFNGNMNEFIQKKFVYPQIAIEGGYQGKCYVRFVVEKDGNITNVSIARGIPDCPECDKEAMRVVKAMPNWKPGKNNGKPVRMWCQLPINFVLN